MFRQPKTHQGKAKEALNYYQEFLVLWKDADPDIPIPERGRGGVREAAVTTFAIVPPRSWQRRFEAEVLNRGQSLNQS